MRNSTQYSVMTYIGKESLKKSGYMHMHGNSLQSQKAKNAGDPGSIPGWGKSPEEENVTPLQYSCLENSMDKGAW